MHFLPEYQYGVQGKNMTQNEEISIIKEEEEKEEEKEGTVCVRQWKTDINYIFAIDIKEDKDRIHSKNIYIYDKLVSFL